LVDDNKILSILKENPKQLFSVREIADILESTIAKVAKRMSQLIKYNLIKTQKINRMIATKIYGKNYKRGLTLYYVEPG